MKKLLSILFISIVTLSFSSTPETALAQLKDYTLLAPIPGLSKGSTDQTDLNTYIEGAFNLAITIGAILAFIMITYGGIMYSTTDALSGKEEGRGIITNAVVGLILVLSSWVILYTINPDMVSFNLTLKRPAPPEMGIINAPPCVECQTLASLSLPPKNGGGVTGESKVHNSIGYRLQKLNAGLGNTGWYISEAHPPTANHANSCHRLGTCVDANINNPSPANIRRFIDLASASGLRAVYEVKTNAERDALMEAAKQGKFKFREDFEIDVVPYINAPHFSVYIK